MFGRRLVMFGTRLIMFGRGLGRGVGGGGGYGGGGGVSGDSQHFMFCTSLAFCCENCCYIVVAMARGQL